MPEPEPVPVHPAGPQDGRLPRPKALARGKAVKKTQALLVAIAFVPLGAVSFNHRRREQARGLLRECPAPPNRLAPREKATSEPRMQ